MEISLPLQPAFRFPVATPAKPHWEWWWWWGAVSQHCILGANHGAEHPRSPSGDPHLGNLPHVLNGGPFIGELGKGFLDLGNEAVDVEVGLGPALWEVKLRNAFTQRCGDGLLRPHLGLGGAEGKRKGQQ